MTFFPIFFFFNLFIYFWLCRIFVAAHGLSLVASTGGYSLLQCTGFSLQWLLLFQSMGSRHTSFSSCGTRAQVLWLTGLVALQHVGSSQTRHRTRVPCIGRQILNHWATREVPGFFLSIIITVFFQFYIFHLVLFYDLYFFAEIFNFFLCFKRICT